MYIHIGTVTLYPGYTGLRGKRTSCSNFGRGEILLAWTTHISAAGGSTGAANGAGGYSEKEHTVRSQCEAPAALNPRGCWPVRSCTSRSGSQSGPKRGCCLVMHPNQPVSCQYYQTQCINAHYSCTYSICVALSRAIFVRGLGGENILFAFKLVQVW